MINNDIIIQASEYYKSQFDENQKCETAKYITETRKFSKEGV